MSYLTWENFLLTDLISNIKLKEHGEAIAETMTKIGNRNCIFNARTESFLKNKKKNLEFKMEFYNGFE